MVFGFKGFIRLKLSDNERPYMIPYSNFKKLNPNPSKQVQEVIFSRKSKRSTHPPLVFKNNNVSQTFSQKHLGVILVFKLTFEEHLNNALAKFNKTVSLLCKLRNILPRTMLITTYKAFIWPYLDYDDVLYDQVFNKSFKKTWNLFNIKHA